MKFFVVVIVVLFLTVGAVYGTTYYVNGSCGNDGWSGISTVCSGPDGPKQTIAAGIGAASAGDTVVVAPGAYSGAGNTNLNFAGKAITLRSENGPGSCSIIGDSYYRAFVFDNGENADTVVEGFYIDRCWSSTYGGAVYCLNSSPTIRNCEFYLATADNGGGAIYSSNSSPVIENCRFHWCNPINTGGAIHITNGGAPMIKGCDFDENYVPYYEEWPNTGGGAIYCKNSGAVIVNSLFRNNWARAYGGAIFSEGSSSQLKIINCLLYNNRTTLWSSGLPGGGAIMAMGGTVDIYDSTLSGNSSARNYGGGIAGIGNTTVTIHNSIIWGNSAAAVAYGYEIYLYGSSASGSITYSDLYDGTRATYADYGASFTLGSGVLSVEPQFQDVANGNYHLAETSPLIDMGDNNAVGSDLGDLDTDGDTVEPVPFDLDGNVRVSNAIVDMGAYEIGIHCPTNPLGDINDDCRVDILDIALLGSSWLECNTVPQSECN